MNEPSSHSTKLDGGACEIIRAVSDTEVSMQWKGSITDRNPGSLMNPPLEEAFSLGEKGSKLIHIDMGFMEYMNSSAIAVIVRFIEKVKNSENRLLITYNKEIKWQQRGFTALEIFVTEDGRIRIQGIKR